MANGTAIVPDYIHRADLCAGLWRMGLDPDHVDYVEIGVEPGTTHAVIARFVSNIVADNDVMKLEVTVPIVEEG